MIYWSTFLLGLVGSLHCIGMCGPLALAVPTAGVGRSAVPRSRLVYNAGRIVTYMAIGLIFGLVGQSLAFAGLQRWVSLGAGFVLLAALFLWSRWSAGLPVTRMVMRMKGVFGRLLKQRSFGSLFVLGLLNGLLPCGLVYAAAATAAATGSAIGGAQAMGLFGLGTLPVMFGVGLVGHRVQGLLRHRLQRLIPASLLVVALLLVFRGLALGIPYLSPAAIEAGGCAHCQAASGKSAPAAIARPVLSAE